MIAAALVLGMLCSCSAGSPPGDAISSDPAPDDVIPSTPPDELAFTGDLTETIRLGLVRSGSTDPTEVAGIDQSSVIVADLLYDGLVEVVAGRSELRPALASEWTANAEMTEWEFKIDQVRGISAAQVVTSFEHLRRTETSGSLRAVLSEIDDISVHEGETVRFDLASPNGGFPWLVSGLGLSIMGPDGAPTGRYRLDTESGDLATLVAVDEDLPDIEIHWVATENDAYALLTSGQVDAAVVDSESLNEAEERFGEDFEPRAISRFYVLNRNSESLSTQDQRRKVLAAIDPAAVVEVDLAQELQHIDGVVPPSVPGYVAGCYLACQDGEEDGTPGESGITLRIAHLEHDESYLADKLAQQLDKAGFDTTVEPYSARGLAQAIISGNAEMFEVGWVAPASSVDAIIPYLLDPSSPANMARIDSSRAAALIDRARGTADDRARWELYEAAQQEALAQGLILPLASTRGTLARADHAKSIAIRADGSIDVERTADRG